MRGRGRGLPAPASPGAGKAGASRPAPDRLAQTSPSRRPSALGGGEAGKSPPDKPLSREVALPRLGGRRCTFTADSRAGVSRCSPPISILSLGSTGMEPPQPPTCAPAALTERGAIPGRMAAGSGEDSPGRAGSPGPRSVGAGGGVCRETAAPGVEPGVGGQPPALPSEPSGAEKGEGAWEGRGAHQGPA